MMDPAIEKAPYETASEYAQRCCVNKELLGLTWKQLAKLINESCGLSYSEAWYRKHYKEGKFNIPEYDLTEETPEDPDNSYEERLNNTLHKINIRKFEVADMIASNNAMLRRMSREETIKDIAADYARVMAQSKPMLSVKNYSNQRTGKEGILLLSDWHYGLVCDNYWNKFDPQICKERVSNLLNKVKQSITEYKIQRLTVLNLSDLIAGRIHSQIRIESRFDVITQTMDVCEILAEFLEELSLHCPVDFYTCLDNHSRLEPNKKESLDLESLVRLIPWYLNTRLANNHRTNIFVDNEFGDDIITCHVLGHNVAAVHGHDDSPNNALESLSLFTDGQYDLICMAHRHHMWFEEQFESIVLSNGCLVGVDTHSKKHRLRSTPSQTLIIVTEDNVIDNVKRIIVMCGCESWTVKKAEH